MNEEKKLLPKLRFPEFQGSAYWQIKTLGQACHMQAGKFVPAADIHDQYTKGLFPCYGGNGLRGYTATFTHTGKYSLIGRQGALCGNIKQGIGQFHATEHAIVVTPKNGTTGDWLFFVLDLMNLNRFATGQAQPGLSVDFLEKLPIAIPSEEAEQQKIADCLSSLDELIAAQARKVDALKTHKKGLMQQIFPREGETQPCLRFPEFRDVGVWVPTELGRIASFSSGGTPSKENAEYWNGNIPWISASSMYELHVSKADHYVTPLAIGKGTRLAKKGTLLILVRGSMLFKRVPMCVAAVDVAFNQDVKAIKVAPSVENTFLIYQLLANESRITISETGIGAGKIELEDLKKFDVLIPSPPEQRRVAECLSNLDDLVNSSFQELETLKTHKKGLMQQLFPSAQAVEA